MPFAGSLTIVVHRKRSLDGVLSFSGFLGDNNVFHRTVSGILSFTARLTQKLNGAPYPPPSGSKPGRIFGFSFIKSLFK